MVQYTLPYIDPNSSAFKDLSTLILGEADKYIKARKMTKFGAWASVNDEMYLPWGDYRGAALLSKQPNIKDADGNIVFRYFEEGKDMVFYRILMDQQAANDWMNFVTELGFHTVRIVTEEDRGVVEGVPANLKDFPSDETVAQFLWTE